MRADINLNRKLVLESVAKTADGAGGYWQSWASLGTLWADVDARAGRQSGVAGGGLSVVRYRIIVRGAPVGSTTRPQAGQRFRDGSRTFVIDAVANHDVGGLYLECWAREEKLS
jgi:head-tail adaptor